MIRICTAVVVVDSDDGGMWRCNDAGGSKNSPMTCTMMESMTRGPGAEVPVPCMVQSYTFTNLWGGTTLAGGYKIQQTQCWMLPVYYYARLVIVSAALDPGLLIFVSRPGYKIWRPSQNVRRTLCSQPQSQQFPACAVPPAPFSLVKLSTGLCNISPCCLVTVLKNHFPFSKCLNS